MQGLARSARVARDVARRARSARGLARSARDARGLGPGAPAPRAGWRALPLALAAVACAAGGAGGAGPAVGARELPADATVRRDPALGTIRFLEGPDLSRGLEADPAFRAARAGGDPAEIARAFVAAYAVAFRLARPAEELALRDVRADRAGRRIARFDQRFRGLPVLRSELRVHVDPDGRVVAVVGSTIPTPDGVEVDPALGADEARARAAAALGRPAGACGACRTELAIAPGAGAARLAWRVRPAPGALHDELLLDARTGAVLARVPVALPGGVGGGFDPEELR
jgi:hypothetical protein